MMETGNEQFWTTLAQTAATLAGFSLAGFSISAASADRVESDEICRRYGLREKSAFASWAFVFLVLMLFFFPLLLSLERLLPIASLPELSGQYWWIVSLGLFLFILIAVALVIVELQHIKRLIRFNIAEKEFNAIRGATKPSQTRWAKLTSRIGLSRVGLWPRLLAIGLIYLIPLTTLLWIGIYIVKPFGEGVPEHVLTIMYTSFSTLPSMTHVLLAYQLINIVLSLSPTFVCVLSLVLGLVGIFVHFHLFRPEQLLFSSADPAELDLWRFQLRLEDIVRQIESMQAILVPVVKKPDERVIDAIVREDQCDRNTVLRRFRELEGILEGRYYDPRTNETKMRQESLEYHKKTIEFCMSQPYLRYGSIRGLFKELEMFDLGLRKLSADLVHRREQYISLFRFLESKTGRGRKPPKGAESSHPSRPSQPLG
jgi:hypothetical protein